jgi:AcrR family transcriptional regulator
MEVAAEWALPGADQQATPRGYRSSARQAQARRTRRRVLAAATAVFLDRGYAGATIRAIASGAGVSVPTVEQLFGTKARILKAAIDVAIVGDDETVPVLDRDWTARALATQSAEEFFAIAAAVLGRAQQRSAGLVLAAFEGSSTDPELADLSAQLIRQRTGTAEWAIDALARQAPLREELSRQDAVETLWVLMDPAVFDRLVRHRGWSLAQYQRWFARSARRLLVADRRRQAGADSSDRQRQAGADSSDRRRQAGADSSDRRRQAGADSSDRAPRPEGATP